MPPNLLNPRDLLLAEAARYLKVRETPKNSNRAVLIDAWLTTVGSPLGSPWCAAFAWCMGLQATGRALWPVKMSGRVQDIVEHAVSERTFTKDAQLARAGDLVVFWYPALSRYGHIAVVERVEAGRVFSIDGNTGADTVAGSPADRDGWGVFRKSRPLSDRVGFIRWAA
jgi:hypothetical protein